MKFFFFFRLHGRTLNGVWSEDPMIACCYEDYHRKPNVLLISTCYKPITHGNGFRFEGIPELENLIKVERFRTAAVAGHFRIKRGDESVVFSVGIAQFANFLDYLVELKYIRPNMEIESFISIE